MAEQNKQNPISISKISNPQLIQQIHDNTNSTKMLSPFTWSHLHIKLPKLPISTNKQQQYSTISEVEQKNSKNGSIPRRKLKKRSIDKEIVKLQIINKTINVEQFKKETKSQQNNKIDRNQGRYRKQSLDNVDKSVNLQFNQKYIRHHPDNLREYKRELITRHLQKAHNRNQSPKESIINKTARDFTRLQSPISVLSSNPYQCIPQTFSYNKIQTYIYKALIKSNWCEVPSKGNPIPELVWSDHYIQQSQIKPNQIHNHIQGSHLLTSKNNLHDLQSAMGSEHYPTSFVMPFQYQNFCEEYEQTIVKICLKDIIRRAYPRLTEDKSGVNAGGLADVLQSLRGKTNVGEDALMAVRLCLYLEDYRKKNSEQYVPIQTNLQLSVLSTLLKTCFQYHQLLTKHTPSPKIPYLNPTQIPQQLLHILHKYHKLLLKNEPSYNNLSYHNKWIIKPIASSRGAGISLLKNNQQFFSINHDRFEFSNKIKFANKIIQKYIQEPMLIQKKGVYQGRKFDIRQWVLVTCDSSTLEPLIYIFQEGYCRFSDMKFTYNHYRSQQQRIHLTNYSISDKSHPQHSFLTLSQLFTSYIPTLQPVYRPQLTKILIETLLNCQELKFEPNRFQLLGVDLIFDRFSKLWILEINCNPACQASRSNKLEAMADRMVQGMMRIVKGAAGKTVVFDKQRENLGWVLVYGQEKFRQVQLEQVEVEAKIKPFYSLSLGSQSLVEQVRKRNMMMNAILKTVTRSNTREIWKILAQYKPNNEEKAESQQAEGNQIKDI